MKYYRDINGDVYAYESDGSQDDLIGDKVELTTEEVSAHLTPLVTQSYVPESITRIQAMRILKSMNLWDQFKTELASNQDAQDEWDLATELQRHNEFVNDLAPALSLTSEQLDNLFIEASKL